MTRIKSTLSKSKGLKKQHVPDKEEIKRLDAKLREEESAFERLLKKVLPKFKKKR